MRIVGRTRATKVGLACKYSGVLITHVFYASTSCVIYYEWERSNHFYTGSDPSVRQMCATIHVSHCVSPVHRGFAFCDVKFFVRISETLPNGSSVQEVNIVEGEM
jgi:hypothetical protein